MKMEQTAENALKQIDEKCYAADLIGTGINEDRIYKLGFAFDGKEVLVIERL